MNIKTAVAVGAVAALAAFPATAGASAKHHTSKPKVHVVYRVPASCKTAINDYKSIGQTLVGLVGDYSSQILPAAEAGEAQDVASVDTIAANMKTWNAEISAEDAVVTTANNEAALCEAGY